MNRKIMLAILAVIIILAVFFILSKANKLPDDATAPLGEASSNTSVNQLSLSNVKIAVLYERLSDDRPQRTVNEQIQILKDTKADMVFRASWRWNPMPESCSNNDIAKITSKKPGDVTPELIQTCVNSGYSFEDMKNTISAIKKEIPGVIVISAVPAQKIGKKFDANEKTGEIFDGTQTWAMALDPTKWGLSVSKDELQKNLQKAFVADGYYPDITNPDFQKLLLGWAEKQIDAGADGIWIDLLFTQADRLRGITKDANHPAVKESYDAASKIVDEIHDYGKSKGKYIYVGTWPFGGYPYPSPKLDFVTSTPTGNEVYNKKLDENAWNTKKDNAAKTFGNIPYFTFIDWADDNTPLSVFSQKLSKEDQKEFLRTADIFFADKGITFVYPVHGGYIGSSSTILAYGKYKWYDSLAPEFDTYDTIKELAQKKGG